MSNPVNFTYKLNGKFPDGINVFELSPALLSLAQLIQKSHEIVYPAYPRLAINIKPIKEGSFPVEIVAFSQGALQEVLQFIHSKNGQDIKEVLEYLGLIVGVTGFSGASLFALVKAIKGKPAKVEQLDKGQFRYTSIEGASITVIENVHNLFQDKTIQDSAYKSVGKTLELPNVESVESFLNETKDKSNVQHPADLAGMLKEYSIAEIPSHEQETITENRVNLWLHPKRGSYEGEPNAWSFRKGEAEADSITVNISDETFLGRITSGEYRPHCEDVIHAELIERQKIVGSKISRPTYDLIKVIDIKQKPEQIRMDI